MSQESSAENEANLPKCPGRTRPRRCRDSSVSLGNMHQVHLGTDLSGSTRRQSSTKMLDSGRHGRLLADRPRTLLDTSVVTCSTDQADTSFERHFDLPRVSLYNDMRINFIAFT